MPIKFEDVQKIPNGAQFHTADLHVHSYGASSDVTDTSMTVEAIIDSAVGQEISILSITDHNTDKSVESSIEYGQKYVGKLLVLPGVEITTANGHLLAYFPPEKPNLVRDLLGQIGVVGQLGGRDSHTKKSMADVILEVELLGGVCIAAHLDRVKTGFEVVSSGYPNWKKDIITSAGLFGLEFDDAANLIWYSYEDEKTSQGAERKKLLKSREASDATVARVRFAAVQNSDAHTLKDFKNLQSTKTLTRFKLDALTFPAFKIALLDPEARVRVETQLPLSIPRIIGMHIVGGFLDTETYHFSDNLNCFVGGRGTGKSTALHSLAYGLGERDSFEQQDNCPERVIVYCENVDGVRYKYDRIRYSPPTVKAQDGSINDVPPEVFRVEFYGQGEIGEVAKDPLNNPKLLQDFLDRHITISDLIEHEQSLLGELAHNSATLIPHERTASQLAPKLAELKGIDKQLKIAEKGKVKGIAAFQIHLGAEKTLCESLVEIKDVYESGISLAEYMYDYDSLVDAAGKLTGRSECEPFFESSKTAIDKANKLFKEHQNNLAKPLKTIGKELGAALTGLRKQHKEFEKKIADQFADLRKKGLSGSVEELNNLIK